MVSKNKLFGVFVVSTIVLLALSLTEYIQVAQIRSSGNTVTVTIEGTNTLTNYPPVTSSSPSTTPPNSKLHYVIFTQKGACPPEIFWGVPWSVTIGNDTEVQPIYAPAPHSAAALYGTSDSSLASISFALPNGTYQYQVRPSNGYFTPSSGSVTVNGADVTIPIAYTGTSCVIEKTSSSST